MLRSCAVALLALGWLLQGPPVSAQVSETDWTERPDRYAPAGVRGDILPPARSIAVQVRLQHRLFEDIYFGRDEVAPVVILQDWDMAPVSRTELRTSVEIGGGLNEWLAAALLLPIVRQEAEFLTPTAIGRVDATGIGDVELHALAALHEQWPVRAHVSAGVAFPSGSVDQRGATPDIPGENRVLPYELQLGSGTFAFLPAGTLVTENRYGSVGIQMRGRVYLGENDRDWRPGNLFAGTLWMAPRFNDWFSASFRLAIDRWAAVRGEDPAHDPDASPMHWHRTTGGTRVELPVGVNLRFAEGALEGHRLGAEFLLPVHHDLDGPALRSKWGAALTWGYNF